MERAERQRKKRCSSILVKMWLSVLLLMLLSACGKREGILETELLPSEEQRLVIYTSHKREVWWPIVKEFEERSGIWTEVTEGGSNELLKRIAEESGQPKADLMFGGGVDTLQSSRELFAPCEPLGLSGIAPEFRDPDGYWTAFSALPVVLIYNTKLLDPGQLRGWEDLMRPMFQGKLAFADPAKSGSNFTALVTLCRVLAKQPGPDGEREVLKEFAAQLGGVLLDNSGDVMSTVADGKALAGITLEESALKGIAAGKNIALVYPAEGTSVIPDGSAVLRGARHRENAERFLEFVSGEDVQRLLQRRLCRRSVRKDAARLLEQAEGGAAFPALQELHPINYDLEEISMERDALLMSWEFYFGTPEGEEAGQ